MPTEEHRVEERVLCTPGDREDGRPTAIAVKITCGQGSLAAAALPPSRLKPMSVV